MKWALYRTLWNKGQAMLGSEQWGWLEALDSWLYLEKAGARGGGRGVGVGGVHEEVADCRVTHTSPQVEISPDAQFPALGTPGVDHMSVDLSPPLQKREIKAPPSFPQL